MSWQPKHVIALAAALSAGLTLSPVASFAAGQLMTIVDSSTNKPAAVTTAGRLAVDSRPSVTSVAQSNKWLLNTTARQSVSQISSGRHAIQEISIANMGTSTARVYLDFVRRTSGSATCSSVGSWAAGTYTYNVLRNVVVPPGDTVTLSFAGTPVVTPIVFAGQLICVTAQVSSGSTENVHVGMSHFLA